MTDTASNENRNKDQSVAPGFEEALREAQRLFDLEQLQERLLATQHQNNLKIHEKQASLSRELHEKQEKSSQKSLQITVAATITATICGSLLGVGLSWYLSPKSEEKPQSKISEMESPLQRISAQSPASKETGILPHKKALEIAAPAAVVLKNSSSVAPVRHK